MKCLSVCQPHAWFFFATDEEAQAAAGLPRKHIENRSWHTPYRGPLLIHAGLNKKWLAAFQASSREPTKFPELVYGAILGVVELTDCIWSERADVPEWVMHHAHRDVTSEYWWAVEKPRRFLEPIPYRGMQQLFDVPLEVVRDQLGGTR